MRRWFILLVAAAFVVPCLPAQAPAEPVAAEDKQTAKAPAEKPRRLRLVKPWADITSLTEDQKQRIMEIHAEYVEKMNQLRDEEEAAILALLTDENKSELAANEAAKKQAAKERAAQRRAEQRAATTKPAGE